MSDRSARATPLVDAEARARIERDLDRTLVVEAAAGTGKTTALVSRIVAAVSASKASLDRLVAVTFTEAAAGEMKLRLRAKLEEARTAATDPSQRAALLRAVEHLEAARIGTIHSLCADLLRERPIEARVDPLFQVAADDEAQRLFDAAFDAWFESILQDPPDGVRRQLRRRPQRWNDPGARAVLRDAAWDLAGRRDFDARWSRDPHFDRDAEIDATVEALRAHAPLGAQGDAEGHDGLRDTLVAVARLVEDIDRSERVRPRDYDGLEAELIATRDWFDPTKNKGYGTWYGRAAGLRRSDVLAKRTALGERVARFADRTQADLAASLHHALLPVVDAYDALKQRAGRVDFLDLLLRTRALLRDDEGIRTELQRRFDHVFVDEFQDTDPLQAEILLLLSADDTAERDWRKVRPVRGKLFIVGDPKQSIYRFRRADVALYTSIKRALVAQGAEVLHLTTSFRSTPTIQSLVNATFAPVMIENEAGSQAAYVPLSAHRADVDGQPAVVALPVPRPIGKYGTPVDFEIERSYPDAVGAFVAWLVEESGWKVSERGTGERVPVAARHVCLLFKRMQSFGEDLSRPYVQALEARRIPHVLVGGRSFHEREEVMSIRTALEAIEWPDDELSVFATLRGPLFALGDDALLLHKSMRGALHPLRPREASAPTDGVPSPLLDEVQAALDVLADLHRARNRRPIADTIGRLLDATRAHAGIAIWRNGEQALANVLRVVDAARRFEAGGAISFRAFLDALDLLAVRGQSGEAPIVEEGTDGVRIINVHKAKGLEFPVVVLCDPTAPMPRRPSHHAEGTLWAESLAGHAPRELLDHAADVVRRDTEEIVRLAYVATTRARDLLVVPALGEGRSRKATWLDALHRAVHPPYARRRRPTAAIGCPPFGVDTVLDRGPGAKTSTDDAIAPGAHVAEDGGHTVVWWDPRALRLDVEPQGGVRHQAILEEEGQADEARRRYLAWRAAHDAAVERAAAPSLVVRSITGSDAALPASTSSRRVSLERISSQRHDPPRGARFGTLVHAIFATLPLDADAATITAIARAQGRLVDASDDEVTAAVARVVAAWSSPRMQAARTSTDVRREVAVARRCDVATIEEGIVDLAYRDAEGWVVVDFKTDADVDRSMADYVRQLESYVAAIEAATGEQARGVVLSV